MKLRIKKLPILLPLLLVAVALIAAAVMARLSWDSAAAHTDLGQKYLNDMDYTGAVTEFLPGGPFGTGGGLYGLRQRGNSAGNPGTAY